MTEQPPSDSDVSRLLRLAGRRPAVPAEVAARVHQAVRARWQDALAHRRRRRNLARAGLAAAAAVAVFLLAPRPAPPPPVPALAATVERVVGGGLRMEGAGTAVLPPGARVPVGAWLETAPDGRAALRVARGAASLRLDLGTRLRVLTASEAWLERGAVYVESDGQTGTAALRIQTREGQVADVGTQFQVRASAGGVQVHVREGHVFVLGHSGRHEAGAGTRLEVAGGEVRTTSAPGHGPAWAWVEEAAPEYDIEGRSLDAFLVWASRQTGLRVQFESERLERSARRTLLHGSSRGLTPSQAIEAVLPASGLLGRRQGSTLWIARAPAEVR
jgi:FecR-like protein